MQISCDLDYLSSKVQGMIVRDPLTVRPEAIVKLAIAQMNEARSINSANRSKPVRRGQDLADFELESDLYIQARSSCLLVVENEQVIGVLTEKDLINAWSKEPDFDQLEIRAVMNRSVMSLPETFLTDVLLTINWLQHHQVHHVAIVNEQNRPIGLITDETLQYLVRSSETLHARTAAEIISPELLVATADCDLFTIARAMAEESISSVIVVDSVVELSVKSSIGSSIASSSRVTTNQRVTKLTLLAAQTLETLGLITERNVVQCLALGDNLRNHLARSVMQTPIAIVHPQDSLAIVADLLAQSETCRPLVTDDRGIILGIITPESFLHPLSARHLYQQTVSLAATVTELAAQSQEIVNQDLNQDLSQSLTSSDSEINNSAGHLDVFTQTSILNQAILDATDYAIISCRNDGIVQVFNAAAERMLGYSSAEIVNKCTPEIFHDRQEMVERAAQLSIELGEEILPNFEVFVTKVRRNWKTEQEWLYVRKDGSKFPVRLCISSLKDKNQTIIGFVGIAQDISNQQQAEQDHRQLLHELSAFKLALDEAAIVAITDKKGVITYANDHFCTISGYSRSELIGQTHRLVNSGYHPASYFQTLWETIRRGEIWRGEICNVAKDGRLYWLDTTITPFFGTNGQPLQYLAIRFDITNRKLAEAEVYKENIFRQQILDCMAEGLCVGYKTKTFPFVYFTVWNSMMVEITGYTIDEVNHLGWQEVFPSPLLNQDQAIDRAQRLVLGENLVAEEWEIRHRNGELRTLSISTSILLGEEGRIYVLGLIQDATKRKQAEAAHRLLQDRLEFLLDSSPAMIYSCKPDGNYGATFVSRNVEQILGYQAEEFLTEEGFWADHLHPDDRERIFTEISDLFKHSFHKHEYRFLHHDGHYVWLRDELRIVADDEGKPIEIVGYFADISDIKKVEQQLRHVSDRLKLALQAGSIGTWDWDLVNEVQWDDQMYAIYGLQDLGRPARYQDWLDRVHPDDRDRVVNALQLAMQGEQEFNPEFRIYRPDGTLRWIRATSITLHNAQGAPIRMTGMNQDITDRKAADEAIKQQLAAMEAAIDGIAVLRGDTYLYLNRSHVEMFGYSNPDELVGQTWQALYSESEVARLVEEVFPILGRDHAWEGEAIATRKDGSTFNEGLSLTLTDNGLLICICRDISNQKKIELALASYTQEVEDLYNNAPCGYHSLDREGRYVRVNETELSWLGYRRDEMIGKPITNFLTESSRQAFLNNYPLFIEQEVSNNLEYDMIRKNGSILPIMLSSIAVKDEAGNYLYNRATLVDIRDRRKADEITRQQATQEILLREITQRIRQSLDLETIFVTACQEVRLAMRADRVGIFKFDPQSSDDGEFVAESVINGFPSVLDIHVHDHCFGETYAPLYLQGRYQAVADIDQAGFQACHRDVLSQFQVRANLVLPLLSGQDLWGLLCIHQCSGPRAWQQPEIDFMRQLTTQLVIAIQQASLYDQIQADLVKQQQAEARIALELRRNQALGAIIQQIRQSLDIHQILTTVTQQVQDILHSDRVIIFQLFPNGNSQIVEETVIEALPSLKNKHWDNEVWSQDIVDHYLQGKPRIVPDVMDDIWTDCLIDYSREGQIQSKIVAPILQDFYDTANDRWTAPSRNNVLWGVLVVHACREKRVWQDSEAQLLQQIANQLAIAIQQANLFEQLQQQLRERQAAQQQLSERNRELAISNEELARATRLKDEFLANMSHELRTPLNAILGITEGLQDEVFGILNKQQIKVLNTIERSGKHLLELINDILDLAKIESGQVVLDYTWTNLNHLCDSSLVFIKHQAMQKKIKLSVDIDPSLPDLMLDERRIRQVLINLLNNAVKFTPSGGSVSLIVMLKPIDHDSVAKDTSEVQPQSNFTHWLEIAIVDTGIGILAKDIKQLFQPFVQVDSALNRQYSGTGLGLALVKRIIELHSGCVHVTSEVGLGSRFVVQLPFSLPDLENPSSMLTHQAQPSTDSVTPHSSLTMTISPLILLAEDNEANVITISSYLEAKGYRVVLAANGEEAIEVVKNSQPNLVLMDIQMPGMDGLEAIQKIRAQQLTDLPIIAVTALAMAGDRERCLAAGADEYLSKPVKLKQLATMIEQFLAR